MLDLSWVSAGKNAHNFKTPSSQDVAVALVTPPKNVSFLLRDEQGASAAPEKLDNGCAVLRKLHNSALRTLY